MDAVPIEAVGPIAVSLGGAAFALAGLWILWRSGGGAVHSAAALVVFLAGAALLALPWVGRGEPGGPPGEPTDEMPVLSLDGTAAPPEAPPPLPGRPAAVVTIEAREAEPNDNLAVANVAALGTAIAGTLGRGDLDYFAVPAPADRRGEIVVNLLALEGDAELTLFDDAGQALGTMGTRSELSARTVALVRKLDRPRYHVLVLTPAGEAAYQLTIAARRR